MKPLDRNHKLLEIGDKVKWYDPEEEYQDLSRTYEIYDINEDIILIGDEYGESEVYPNELEILIQV